MTFLFTDVEGSTRLWEQHPDAMKAALAVHDGFLRSAIADHHGYVFSTAGDSFAAAFHTADDAVAAGIAAQLAASAEVFDDAFDIKVRMGIHTGVADERDGDYFGSTVNRAARVMGAGHGGQILVSADTASLLSDVHDTVDLGTQTLRDLAEPIRVIQVNVPGASAGFPKLKTIDAFPGNLPTQLTSFVGRKQLVDDVAAVLDDVRLVTLTGVGGVGKTRLAVQVAAETLDRFEGGAWFCSLTAVRDRAGVTAEITGALGLSEQVGRNIEDAIFDTLELRPHLLILDNCEHILDDIADLAEAILERCPDARLLCTSREGLALRGERIIAVPTLPVISDDGAAAGAVQLFFDRALDVGPATAIGEDQTKAVHELCASLDGVPLAIELAAARTVAMTPMEILERLDERFRLLTGGRRGSRNHHQTLRQTVDWSYELLNESEKLVLQRLSVFAGSFDLGAVEAVAGDGLSRYEADDTLESLVAKSLVVTATGGARSRYSLLETIRQYAAEHLADAGGADAVRTSHANHYIERATDLGARLLGPDEFAAVASCRLEARNFRAVFDWAVDAGNVDTTFELITPFSRPVFSDIRPFPELAATALTLPTSQGHARESDLLALGIQ